MEFSKKDDCLEITQIINVMNVIALSCVPFLSPLY